MTATVAYLLIIVSLPVVLAVTVFLVITRTEAGFRFYLTRLYQSKFPDIEVVEPGDLLRELEVGATPVLLDTRTPQEYAVSHLEGAILLDPRTFSLNDVAMFNREQPIVMYCSIGYRSGRIARKLRSSGFANVRNLYGGLFLWYNRKQPVVRDGRRVEQIHPYDAIWRMFITRRGATKTPI